MTVELVKVEVTHPETGLVMSSLLPVLREDVEPENDRQDIVRLILATLHAGPKTAAELAEYLDLSGGHLRKFLPEMERRRMIYASTLGKAKVYHLLQRDGSSKTADKSEGYDA
jgi:predicted ArsR family transcriptional regulator